MSNYNFKFRVCNPDINLKKKNNFNNKNKDNEGITSLIKIYNNGSYYLSNSISSSAKDRIKSSQRKDRKQTYEDESFASLRVQHRSSSENKKALNKTAHNDELSASQEAFKAYQQPLNKKWKKNIPFANRVKAIGLPKIQIRSNKDNKDSINTIVPPRMLETIDIDDAKPKKRYKTVQGIYTEKLRRTGISQNSGINKEELIISKRSVSETSEDLAKKVKQIRKSIDSRKVYRV